MAEGQAGGGGFKPEDIRQVYTRVLETYVCEVHGIMHAILAARSLWAPSETHKCFFFFVSVFVSGILQDGPFLFLFSRFALTWGGVLLLYVHPYS